MEVINRPEINYTKKSIKFLLGDKRKKISALIILLFPILSNVWRFIPEDIAFPFYETLYIFVWTFTVNFLLVLISIAWYFSVPSKDYAMRAITLSALAFGIFSTYQTIPISDDSPLWLDMIATGIIFLLFLLCLRHIQKYYLDRPSDYKTLHDGLVYDLHHQRFMGSLDRIAGLLEIAEIDDKSKLHCAKEIEDLRGSVAYIAEKYEALN